ncbi:hypothetical protein [Frigoribacterium sp. UYMn621]|uniref:hypothetical protein n=1 Tax=Frigoribacterium sp. UYMn621 TaxID=3156343 RepID=UPI003396E5F2
MPVFMPPINLDVNATPWAKAMQQRMDDVELSASRSANEGANANSTAAATLNVVARQIADLKAVVALLGSLSATAIYNNSGMALPTGVQTVYLTVPAGMTKMSYTAFAFGSGRNPTGATDNVLIYVTGPTGNSGIATVSVAPGATQYVSAGTVGTLSGLVAGQQMAFQTSLSANSAWAANAGNTINTQVLGVFQP